MAQSADICIQLASKLKEQQSKAESLSADLALPICTDAAGKFKYHLVYNDHRLELHHNPDLQKFKVLPVYVDFLQKGKIHRRLATATIKDPLAKSVGIKSGARPDIIDATAGLGMDAMQLCWLGCKMTLLERSPVVYALLKDGLIRARKNERLRTLIENNITLLHGDASRLLHDLSITPQTILLDPMYPEEKKGPKNKKEMRVLRQLVGDDTDVTKLFDLALKKAKNRVVVKRPKYAPCLVESPPPTHEISMKSGRFDVYLIDHL